MKKVAGGHQESSPSFINISTKAAEDNKQVLIEK
jgi:hypothetical protein